MRVIHAAVSDRAGFLEFCPRGPFGFVATPQTNLPRVKVRALTVDQILQEAGWDHVDFIKMDIEGSEVAAIGGMQELLKKDHAPPILYESNTYTLSFYKKTANELKASLKSFGYNNHTVEPGKLIRVAANDFQPQVVTDYFAFKKKPTPLRDWEIRPPIGRESIIRQVLESCAIEDHKAHIARDLFVAPRWLLTRSEVKASLAALRHDPRIDVREAAAWSQSSRWTAYMPMQIRRWLKRSA